MYDEQIPQFLHNRPLEFVQHIMKRWDEAYNRRLSLLTCDEPGVYFVRSSASEQSMYKVVMANGVLPSCQCHDWKRHHKLCKHMLAVIRHEDNTCTWESLPVSYRNIPFVTLHISLKQTTSLPEQHEAETEIAVDEGSAEEPKERTKVIDISSIIIY